MCSSGGAGGFLLRVDPDVPVVNEEVQEGPEEEEEDDEDFWQEEEKVDGLGWRVQIKDRTEEDFFEDTKKKFPVVKVM